MLAKKCDRCGRLYEHYDGQKVFPKSLSNSLELRDTDCRGSIWPQDRFDLCKDCMTKLESFFCTEVEIDERRHAGSLRGNRERYVPH